MGAAAMCHRHITDAALCMSYRWVGTATSPLSSSLLLRSTLLPSFTCSCLLLKVDAGDCGVAVAGESYSANFFICRQCFSFSLLFGRGSDSLAIVAESKKQTKQANKYRMSFVSVLQLGWRLLYTVSSSIVILWYPIILFISVNHWTQNSLSLVGGLRKRRTPDQEETCEHQAFFHPSWSREIAK